MLLLIFKLAAPTGPYWTEERAVLTGMGIVSCLVSILLTMAALLMGANRGKA